MKWKKQVCSLWTCTEATPRETDSWRVPRRWCKTAVLIRPPSRRVVQRRTQFRPMAWNSPTPFCVLSLPPMALRQLSTLRVKPRRVTLVWLTLVRTAYPYLPRLHLHYRKAVPIDDVSMQCNQVQKWAFEWKWYKSHSIDGKAGVAISVLLEIYHLTAYILVVTSILFISISFSFCVEMKDSKYNKLAISIELLHHMHGIWWNIALWPNQVMQTKQLPSAFVVVRCAVPYRAHQAMSIFRSIPHHILPFDLHSMFLQNVRPSHELHLLV